MKLFLKWVIPRTKLIRPDGNHFPILLLNTALRYGKVFFTPYMTPESNTPAAVQLETEKDLAWIHAHVALLSSKACGWFKLVGRGAILVDAAAKPLGDESLFTYFDRDKFGRFDDEEVDLILETYEPTEEFVLVMLRARDQLQAYRIEIPDKESSN